MLIHFGSPYIIQIALGFSISRQTTLQVALHRSPLHQRMQG
jgi:hypothetical protein